MSVLFILLLLAAAVCFGISAFAPGYNRVNFIGLGLLFWVLVPLIQAVGH